MHVPAFGSSIAPAVIAQESPCASIRFQHNLCSQRAPRGRCGVDTGPAESDSVYAMLINSASALLRAFLRGLRGPRRCPIHMKTQHMRAPAPAAPRRGGRWCPRVLCFHAYEAPAAAPRPRKVRFKAEALLSNIAYL
jgi:hypothetical protein